MKSHESDAVVENTRALMESMALSKDKFGRRSTTKDEKAEVKMTKVDVDGGWDVNAYKMTKEDDGTCVSKALPPASFYEAYGQKAPSEADRAAYDEKHEEEVEEDDKKSPYIEDDDDAIVIAKINKILVGKQTAQSMFLSLLADRGLEKSFTYKEIIELLAEAKYKEPRSFLPSYYGKKEKKFGFNHKLFNVSGQHHTVRPELRVAWSS